MIRDTLRDFTVFIWRLLFAKKAKIAVNKEKFRKRIFEPEEEETTQVSYLSRTDFDRQKLDKHVEVIMVKYEKLRGMTPSTSKFLGEDIDYPETKRRFYQLPRPLPDLTKLREEIENFSKGESASSPRNKIKRHLKYHPSHPELHAINGIQMYNDTMQSGLDEKKLDVLQQCLVEIGQAMYNGAISVYNVNWFITIYTKYLEAMQRRILAEYNLVSTNYHWQVQKIAAELHLLAIQITSMLSIREQLAGMATLTAKLKNSTYNYDSITKEEIRGACLALEGDGSRHESVGKSPKYVLWAVVTIATLFARAPMLTKLVSNLLSSIPDSSRMLVLQKNMVGTVLAVVDYHFALSQGDLSKKIETAHRLYTRCLNVINQHLGHVSPKRTYEVDPFLKAAWITKESNGLFERDEYRTMLEQSMEFLDRVMESPDTVKGSFDIARRLQDDLHGIMVEYGWAMY
ncbi:MAG: hypothetical protein HN590_19230 [Calditrichaeota bacterium]|nr:hypothetical protein [Deltaproteobacteria bacterium]MBT7619416.1 hypothetical protein [Calditrichota bacterium]MBT4087763.1 hypothetical protein [Deltaproteobacteria bacterium]MBT4262599.1 hypothetical protein [Deltaproteobacteria bacterium]MBT4640601.1 hypothetical protein [Deltaproteobacteria bacterium]